MQTSADAHTKTNTLTHACTEALVSHAQTEKYTHNQTNANLHTHTRTILPLLTAPALGSTINNLRHCGACDPVTFDLWS